MGIGTCDHCPATTEAAKQDGWSIVTIEVVRWIPDPGADEGVRQDVERVMELLCPDCAERAVAILERGPGGGQQSDSDDPQGADQTRVHGEGTGGD